MTLQIGTRVVRGPNWKWHIQDNGEGHTGTVTLLGSRGCTFTPDRTAVVMWDFGKASTYRIGFQECHDLAIIDSGPVGHHHPNIVCNNCRENGTTTTGITGMRFKCTQCPGYDLCTSCYMDDVHNLEHEFMRFNNFSDVAGVKLSKREGEKIVKRLGLFKGARVKRGQGWEWGDQDGGEGSEGTLLNVTDWDRDSVRSVVTVQWDRGHTNIYRLGHHGKVDVKAVGLAEGGTYYPRHLPVAAKIENGSPVVDIIENFPFCIGDKVAVSLDTELFETLQDGHGGWNPKMAEYINKIGTVHRITDGGDVRVDYPGCENRWTIHPGALTKKSTLQYAVGDYVKITSNEAEMKKLQEGHGEWIDNMLEILGLVGQVSDLYEDNDMRVAVGDRRWTLNPACCQPFDIKNSSQNYTTTAAPWQTTLEERSIQVDKFVYNASRGKVEEVRKVLVNHPAQVDSTKCGKTALQVASHQGHANVVKLLLENNASITETDAEGDNAIHYAVIGKKPDIVDMLVGAGGPIDAVNKSFYTALHMSVITEQSRITETLIQNNADVNIQDESGDTAFHEAINRNSPRILQLLMDCGRVNYELRNKHGFNCLHQATLKGNHQVMSTIIRLSPQLIDRRKDDGFNALHLAALNGHLDIVKELVENGKANIVLATNRRQSALMLAIINTHAHIVEYLIEKGSDLDFQDEDGNTALHHVSVSQEYHMDQRTTPMLLHLQRSVDSGVPKNVILMCYLIQNGANEKLMNKKRQDAVHQLDSDARLYVQRYTDQPMHPKQPPQAAGSSGAHFAHASGAIADPPGSECMICSDPATVVFHPCQHKIVCDECSARMKKCLHCKQPILRKESTAQVATKERKDDVIERLEEQLQCSICLDRKKNVVFKCGHGACKNCSANMQYCHMCRKRITDRINMF